MRWVSQSPLGLSQDWDEIRRPAAAIVRLGWAGVNGARRYVAEVSLSAVSVRTPVRAARRGYALEEAFDGVLRRGRGV